MTVNTVGNVVTYQGNGSTTTFTFPFAIPDKTNIVILLQNEAGNVTTVDPGDYDVTIAAPIAPNPTSVGGSVTFPLSGPPLPLGQAISIVRILPRVQPVSLSNQSVIYPPVIEKELDYLTMLSQQGGNQADRAFVVPLGEPAPSPVPPLEFRKNQTAVFDSLGNLVAGSIPGGGVIISPVMIPVVTAPTLPDAHAAMEVAPIDSPALTGVPTSSTVFDPPHDNDNTLATTAFVQALGATLGVLIPAGTVMLFVQANAPPGWTKLVSSNNAALRLVSGTGGVGGGSQPFSTVFGRTTTDSHILSVNEMPSHGHSLTDPTHTHGLNNNGEHSHVAADGQVVGVIDSGETGHNAWAIIAGSVQPAMHTDTVTITVDGASTGISLGVNGGSLGHVHDINMQVLYVDVIQASKD